MRTVQTPSLLILLMLILCVLPPEALAAPAESPAPTATREPVVLAHAEQRRMRASQGGREYQIFIAAPTQPARQQRLPVIYVLDANSMFLTTVEAVRAYERRRDDSGGLQAVVVGIGYPPGIDINAARVFDLTPDRGKTRDGHPTGGGDDFRRFIENDLKPVIARDYPVDPKQQALMGHSLGGRFTLETLVQTPEAFQTYIAMSSSFWFDEHALGGRIRAFARARKADAVPVRVLLTAGELEEQLRPDAWMRNPEQAATQQARLRQRGQIRHARQAAEDLAGAAAMLVDFRPIADEDHGSVIPASIARGVDFILTGPMQLPALPSAEEYMKLGPEGRYRLRMQVRALPELQRANWLKGLKTSLKGGLDEATRKRLHAEKQELDLRYGSTQDTAPEPSQPPRDD